MSDIVLNHVVSMNNVSVMNDNFDTIEASINSDCVHMSGGQNILGQDLDLNGHSILNCSSLSANVIKLSGTYLVADNISSISPSIIADLLHAPPVIGDVAPNVGIFTTLVSADTTNSTSSSTGALKTSGGLGVVKDIYCGGSYHGAAYVTAGQVDNTPIGSAGKSTGSFTSLLCDNGSINASLGSTTPSPATITNLTVSGTISGVVGRLLGTQVFTANGTYTPTAGTSFIIVEVQAPGGGGAGSNTTGAGQSSVSGGGGGGAYAKVRINSGFSSVAVTVPAGGAGGILGTAAPDASPASFGSFVSCPGGKGGMAMAAVSVATPVGSSQATAAPTIAGATTLVAKPGNPSSLGFVATVNVLAISGSGGDSIYGGGGFGRSAGAAAGFAAFGYGAGGGGAVTVTASSTGQVGGAGAPGIIIVSEYS